MDMAARHPVRGEGSSGVPQPPTPGRDPAGRPLPDQSRSIRKGFGDGSGGATEAEKSLLSQLIEKFNERHGTDFTEQDFIRPFEEATADPKVKATAVVNDEENFGLVFDNVFADKMADHIDTIAGMGRQYFGPDKGFKSSLDRSRPQGRLADAPPRGGPGRRRLRRTPQLSSPAGASLKDTRAVRSASCPLREVQ